MLLGNDLVWLADPHNQGRSSDLPLIQRILTPRERLMVQVSPEPDRMLWSLWAAKEAAFKALSRDRPVLFAPRRFEVLPRPGSRQAEVTFETRVVPVRWVQGGDWVHALAGDAPEEIESAVEKGISGEAESPAVRELAARLLGGAGRVEGRPPVFRFENGREVPVSLSHDGPYLAVAFRTAG